MKIINANKNSIYTIIIKPANINTIKDIHKTNIKILVNISSYNKNMLIIDANKNDIKNIENLENVIEITPLINIIENIEDITMDKIISKTIRSKSNTSKSKSLKSKSNSTKSKSNSSKSKSNSSKSKSYLGSIHKIKTYKTYNK